MGLRKTFLDEKAFCRHFVDHFRDRYPYLVTLRHEDVLTAGVPDITITRRLAENLPSLVVWLEAKVWPGLKLRALQHDNLARLGGFYLVWDNVLGSTSIYAPKRNDLSLGRVVLKHAFDLEDVGTPILEALTL